jgi:protoporphyrinogen oxidase
MTSRSVAVVGGGILGLTAAYRLAKAGISVAVYERSTDLGGLVGSFDFDGRRVDRFYHVILPTDDRVRGLATELGLGDRFRFRPTGVGFYDDGRLFSMNSLREFLSFPLIPLHDRVRLGAFVARCQLKSTYDDLDQIPIERWLRRQCGRRMVESLWRPLLDSKFDGHFED